MIARRLGIVSDSHGNISDIQIVYERLKERYHIDTFIHLGDDYNDLNNVIISSDIKIIKVPGLYDNNYSSTANTVIEEINGNKILFLHSPYSNDNNRLGFNLEYLIDSSKVNIIIYGHTHIPRIESKDGKIWINPGHIKKEDNKGYPPTYGYIEFGNNGYKTAILKVADGEKIKL